MARPVWKDGGLVPWEEARASALGQSMQRGSLVFDVGAMRERTSPRGVGLFRAREHVQRFLRSAAYVGLEIPYGEDALLQAALETARASDLTSALVRWSAYWPALENDVVPRNPASVLVAVLTAADGFGPGVAPAAKPEFARIGLSRDIRKAGPEVFSPNAKVAASYLGPMIAKRGALAAGHDEVVLLDGEGFVAEAPTSNVFAVRGGALVTPLADRVLRGITRDSILQIAKAENIPTREARLTPEDFASADEAFLAGTSLPVQPIVAIDGRPVGSGAPGPLTSRIRSVLLACERAEDPRFAHWVESVR
jgi:branched-chain amino acid aminotransferase